MIFLIMARNDWMGLAGVCQVKRVGWLDLLNLWTYQ